MLPITGDLGPTATYARRSFAWVPAVNGMIAHRRPGGEFEVLPALGKLTIKLQHGRRCGCKCELDTYAVEEEVEPEEPDTRLFVLLNLTDASQREPYKVTVGGENKCRCIAGCVKRIESCKHRDSLAVLAEEIEGVPCPRR